MGAEKCILSPVTPQQDSLLFLQALKLGFTILTANVREFDLLLQLMPTGRALFYRRDS